MKKNLLSLIFIFSINATPPNKWVNKKPDEITLYIFSPGIFSSETKMAKYLPRFIGSTGEEITCCCGIEVLGNIYSCCLYPEINLTEKNDDSLIRNFIQNIIEEKNNQFKIFVKENLNNLTLKSHWIRLSNLNLAQEHDIETLSNLYRDQVNKLKKNYPNKKINVVLYGASRGAATIFNFVAMHKPKEVKALVCEGIFDSIPNVINHMLGKLSFFSPVVLKIFELILNFDKYGICPINNVLNFPDIPTLLITSKKDAVVSNKCTFNLYEKLKNTNHKKIHFLELNHSKHDYYALGKEKKNYERTVHSFYKQYNLPFIRKCLVR